MLKDFLKLKKNAVTRNKKIYKEKISLIMVDI